jgi:EmrB/QacA subfamily drug resistance transporter
MRAPDQAPARDGIGFRSERGPVLVGLMLCTSLVALDATIIATAVPSIVRDLGGFTQFPWLFSIYLLTQAVTVPLYGKLADVVGRRPVLFFGIGVFVFGSLLCGLAWSMPALIIARAVQGIGAGAVLPMTVTVVGDLYSVEERARVQGYVASVWGVSSVVGPALGGVFAEYLSWRWIFYINLPLGALAAWMLLRTFHESVERRAHQMDIAGAVLLTVGFSLLILGLLEGGVAWDWASPVSLGVFAGAAVALALVVAVERRAAEPVLPLWVLSRRVLVGGNLAAVAVGVVLIGLTSYVPTYVQGVLGTGALVAGFAIAAMTLGWPIAASLSGRVYLRIGFRDTALIGALVVVVGSLQVLLLSPHSAVLAVAAATFVVGVGLGLCSAPTIVAVQSVVDWQRRGVVTATNLFSRNLGSAVGVAVFGAIANTTLARRFAEPPPGVPRGMGDADAERLVLEAGDRSGPVADFVRSALFDASHHVFIGVLAAAVVGFAVLWLMPRRTVPV